MNCRGYCHYGPPSSLPLFTIATTSSSSLHLMVGGNDIKFFGNCSFSFTSSTQHSIPIPPTLSTRILRWLCNFQLENLFFLILRPLLRIPTSFAIPARFFCVSNLLLSAAASVYQDQNARDKKLCAGPKFSPELRSWIVRNDIWT